MGAAEFEFGAVPKAFGRMYDDKLISFEKDGIYYICSPIIKDEVVAFVEKCKEDDYHGKMKEPALLKRSFTDSSIHKIIGWICVDEKNNFIFTTDEVMFEKFKQLFKEGLS